MGEVNVAADDAAWGELDDEPEKVPTDAELAEGYDPDVTPDPPVYDERGNVRPRGTKGARSMTYAERVAIAKRIQNGDQPARRGRRARKSTT